MNIDFELHLCTISNPRPGLTPGTALRAVGSGINLPENAKNSVLETLKFSLIVIDVSVKQIIYVIL